MFVISLEYLVPLEQVEQHLDAHRTFLEQCYEDNIFIVSGRKNPRTGGIIISSMTDKKQLMKILAEDPFCQYNIAKYEVIEFIPTMYHEDFLKVITRDTDTGPH